jgi:hypothetical protein
MMILCDGSVPFDQWDWPCRECAGNLKSDSLADIWKQVRAHAEQIT